MSGKIALDSPAAAARKQPLLETVLASSPPSNNHRIDAKNGEGRERGSRMGQTAGECAAVCCCCPCAMMHLLILAVYRLPKGIWKKKKRKRLLKKKRKNSSKEKENQRKTKEEDDSTDGEDFRGENDDVEWEKEKEKEMWDRFYGGGFWRSHSQRNNDD